MTDEWDKLYDAAVTYGTSPIVASNSDIIYFANAGEEILRIDSTGKVFINPDYTVDEAAKAFWEIVERIHPLRATKIERLRAALENLANACDVVGVAFFDPNSMDPAVKDMQRATQTARDLLKTI